MKVPKRHRDPRRHAAHKVRMAVRAERRLDASLAAARDWADAVRLAAEANERAEAAGLPQRETAARLYEAHRYEARLYEARLYEARLYGRGAW